MTGPKVYQVLVHGAVWDDFNAWLARRNIRLSPPMRFTGDADEMPTYVMEPIRLTREEGK
jgi:hypothetical protein